MTTITHTRRIRQTTLRHLEEHCPAMAYALDVEGREGPSGVGAYRGRAVHEFFSRYVDHLHASGRQTDWDQALRLLFDVFARYPALSYEQRRDITEQAETIAQVFMFRPALYYGTEEPFEATIDLADGTQATITGRVDYLEVEDDVARIVDVKSNHQILPDSRVKLDFQLGCYALLVLENLPQVETVEGRLLLSRYGLYLPQKGTAVWTREDAAALTSHLAHKLAAHYAGTLRREHVPGTWCAYCPLRRTNECTLYRSYYGTTPPPPLKESQAVKLARQIMALEEARETRIELLKQYVAEHGPVSVGSGDAAEVFAFHQREAEEIAATDLLAVLEEHRDLVGDQPLDELLSVNRSGRAYKRLRRLPELRAAFEDVASTRVSTTFGHRAVSA